MDGLGPVAGSILLVIQIDGLHIGNDLVLVGALGIDGEGNKHPLGLSKAPPRTPLSCKLSSII